MDDRAREAFDRLAADILNELGLWIIVALAVVGGMIAVIAYVVHRMGV